MSLLDIPALAALKAAQATPDPVADAKAQLLAEERAAKVDPAVKAACVAIGAKGYGQPTLNKSAAQAWAASMNWEFTGTFIAGIGTLSKSSFEKTEDLLSIAKELEGYPQGSEPVIAPRASAPAALPVQAMGLLPPDAPKSDPVAALAALEAPKAAPQPAPTPEAAASFVAGTMLGFPVTAVAPEPAPQMTPPVIQPSGVTTTTAAASAPPAAEKDEGGELKLSKRARAVFEQMQARIESLEDELSRRAAGTVKYLSDAPALPAGVEVFVDSIPPTPGYTDLSGWVHGMAKRIADKFGAVDVRCIQEKPAAFGGWKGILEALVREEQLADGVYFLDTRGSDIHEAAAAGFRTRPGARVTRGIR